VTGHPGADGPAGDPLDAVAEVIARFGVDKRRLQLALALLTERHQTLDSLVRGCALPRRTVESLLRAAGPDLDQNVSGAAIKAARAAAYRDRFGSGRPRRGQVADPYAALLAAHGDLVARMDADIAAAPAARDALDHVAATADTVVRRALWLDSAFDLAGARLLCIGDHDLSSLAACAVIPGLRVTVVDVDERLLEFIDGRAAAYGYDIQCFYADFRYGLPDIVAGSADVVLTDPPYTPEGVELFLGRGAQGIGDRANGRLVLAYGFSPLHPALGLKVQRAVQDLDLVAEAILPAFNRYHGAQAVGSASDLYVLRPTARTFQILDKKLARTAVNIYTHGAQSLEGRSGALDPDTASAVIAFATGTEQGKPSLLVGERWPAAVGAATLDRASLLASGLPASAVRLPRLEVAVDLADDPGPWLLRVLAAVSADRLAVLVPNGHPDLATQETQRALTALLAPKYALRLRRSTPASRYAIVEATAVEATAARSEPGAAPIARDFLCRAHGKIGNVWREALIRRSARRPDGPLTKNEARALVAEAVSRPAWLEARLIDLPRLAIAALLSEAEASVKAVS
jgi:N4-bis(aminopropyl)spermidine synthase